MKSFGIGTAVMVFALSSSALTFGQERQEGPPGQSPGQASSGQPRPGSTGQSGSRDTTSQDDRNPSQRHETGQADARGFINDLTIANLAEVQLGKMAGQKASSSDVKSFGQMMVQDHTKANDELKQIATQLKVQPPAQLDQKHKDLSDKLSKLSGAEFDREYINAMVMGHEEVLGKLRARAEAGVPGGHDAAGAAGDHAAAAARSQAERGATTNPGHGDQALTQWAATMMPAVQKHLDRAREIQKQVAK